MKIQNVLHWAIVGLLALPACGGDNNDSPGEEVRENILNLLRKPGAQGTWTSDCFGSDLLDLSAQREYVFRGNNFTETMRLFNTANCEDKVAELRYKGEFVIHKDDRKDHARIDFQYDEAIMEVSSDPGAELLNAAKFCGIDGWKKDGTFNLTDESTSEGCPLIDLPTTRYDLIKVVKDELYLGSGGAAAPEKESERPDEVDEGLKFKRD